MLPMYPYHMHDAAPGLGSSFLCVQSFISACTLTKYFLPRQLNPCCRSMKCARLCPVGESFLRDSP